MLRRNYERSDEVFVTIKGVAGVSMGHSITVALK